MKNSFTRTIILVSMLLICAISLTSCASIGQLIFDLGRYQTTETIPNDSLEAQETQESSDTYNKPSDTSATTEDSRIFTVTFKYGAKIINTQRLKAGEKILLPLAGNDKWYIWNEPVPVKMPERDLTFYVSAIGGDAWKDTTWEYDLKGTLSIHGSGNMSNFSENSQPWAEFKSEITSISIDDSITSIGKYAFFGCVKLTSVVIPDSIITIGDYAFANCDEIREITIGANVTAIGTGAFVSSYDLQAVTMRGKLNWQARIDNYYTDLTFSSQNKYENASIFKQYISAKFTAN